MNRVSIKDNYPFSKMDHILQKVVGAHRISTLDGFLGYNQILVHPDDQEKLLSPLLGELSCTLRWPLGL